MTPEQPPRMATSEVAWLFAEIERLRAALTTIRDDYDCDDDNHERGTLCRRCLASTYLAGNGGA